MKEKQQEEDRNNATDKKQWTKERKETHYGDNLI